MFTFASHGATLPFLLVVTAAIVTVTVCQDSTLMYETREERPRGTYIGDVATDSDLSDSYTTSEFKALQYSFIAQDKPFTKFFMIQKDGGHIYTDTKLDRERVCPDFRKLTCTVHLSVAVLSRNDDFHVIPIQVIIRDINDNTPRFKTAEITLDIAESVVEGEQFVIGGAVDNDAGRNSVALYAMDYNEYFKIDTHNNIQGSIDVLLTVKQRLDREMIPHHTLVVKAVDNGVMKLTGSLTINIIVTDVNDHKPAFSKQKYNVTLVESSATGKTVVTLTAVDRDAGKNGDIRYTFGSQTPVSVKKSFSINTKTGDVILQGMLDYETQSVYNFLVIASDSGPQPRSSSAVVTVNVIDVNDEVPKISFGLLSDKTYASLSESSPIAKFVAFMSVIDSDSGTNGEVSCYLNTSKFRLQQVQGKSYKILLNERLDREEQERYDVQVTCQDGGFPPLRGSVSLRVVVKDANDNAPKFKESVYSSSIVENSPAGTVVIEVSATDKDVGLNGKVLYQLHGKHKNYFRIGEKSGQITIASPIDREKIPEVQLLAIAKDLGHPTQLYAQATVIVYIKDMSDEAPAFGKERYEFSVAENGPANMTIGSVFAMDLDQGMAGEVRYSIRETSGPRVLFRISDKDGTIYVNTELDREVACEHSIIVVATDLGAQPMSSSVSVLIVVTDKNDNAPNITFPNSHNDSFTILDSLTRNSVILQILAEDADDEMNARMVYNIKQGNHNGALRLDEASGEMIVARRLSIHDCLTYNLLIMVKDHGAIALFTETYFKVIILHDNSSTGTGNADGSGVHNVGRDGRHGETDEEPDGLNIVIIIIIIVATFIASCLIIIAIYCVRRRDRARELSEKPDDEDGIAKTGDKFGVPPANLDNLDNVSDKCKKEVSFSLEDIQNSQNNSFSTFKGQTGINNKPYNDCPNGSYIALTRTSPHSNHDRYPETNGSCVKMQNYVAPPHRQWTHTNPSQNEMRYLVDYLPRHGSHSDLSGETTLSDSGRGGSEESFNRPALHDLQQVPVLSNTPRQREGVSYMSFEGVDSYVPMDVSPGQKHGSTLPRDYRTDTHRGSNPGIYAPGEYMNRGASPTLLRGRPRRDSQNAIKFNAPLGTTALIETMMKNNNHRDDATPGHHEPRRPTPCCLNSDEKYGVEETGYGTVADSTDCYSISDGDSPRQPYRCDHTRENDINRDCGEHMQDTSFVTSDDGTAHDDDETMTTTSGSYNVSADDIDPTSDPYTLKDVFV